MLPLEGITVLEFAQFLAGPSAGLKLADLGARVIKIERPSAGEAGRKIVIKNRYVGDNSLVFHTINRNKESFTANLKETSGLAKVNALISQADVMIHNFRPGVMGKIGLDYGKVKEINPQIIYAEVTGYGPDGPWARKPGQDLLLQSLSGLAHLTGNQSDAPTPMGMAVIDTLTGAHLTQGILAALVQRGKNGKGAKVAVSLLESALDFQFEVITTWLQDGKQQPKRARKGNAHAYLAAPYGVYTTADGHIAIAMNPVQELVQLIGISLSDELQNPEAWFEQRDTIMDHLSATLRKNKTQYWLDILEPQGIWCAPVLDYQAFLAHEGYQVLQMDQEVVNGEGERIRTTRCPIRIDGKRLFSNVSAPEVGEHTSAIELEFGLQRNDKKQAS